MDAPSSHAMLQAPYENDPTAEVGVPIASVGSVIDL